MELARNTLEAWYAKRIPEELIVEQERAKYDTAMREVDSALVAAQGTIKTVKKEIVPSLDMVTCFIGFRVRGFVLSSTRIMRVRRQVQWMYAICMARLTSFERLHPLLIIM